MFGQSRILVIDDEQSVADALRTILEDDGYEVEITGNGYDGLKRAAELPFALIITDLSLPDASGIDVIRASREQGCSSRIILVTANATPEVIAEAHACGAIEVLSKPFLPSDILSLTRAVLQSDSATDRDSS
ncbi:MAG: response regulator [Acidobacteria bacterium]|nr:response regulator [Acidobacteriota bacterium]